MTDQPVVMFKEIAIGEHFRFVDSPQYGPWIKVSPRKYCGAETRRQLYQLMGVLVGTVHARVQRESQP